MRLTVGGDLIALAVLILIAAVMLGAVAGHLFTAWRQRH
jgi:hypothetical protein